MTPDELRAQLCRLPPVPLEVTPAGWPEGQVFMRRPPLGQCDELRDFLLAHPDNQAAARLEILAATLCDAAGEPLFDSVTISGAVLGEAAGPLTDQAIALCGWAEKKSSTEPPAPGC